MAKNVVPLHGDGSDGGSEAHTTTKAISEREFTKLHKAVKASNANMATERGTIGGLINDAVQNKHLHKGAYGIFRRLDAMDDYKRAELLFHLDLYRERANWDETDLFDRSEAATEAAE